MKKLIFILIAIFTCSLCVYAHPGSLDENGGHWDHKNGEYHYHEGTNQGNGYSSSSTYEYPPFTPPGTPPPKPTPKPTPKPFAKSQNNNDGDGTLFFLIVGCCVAWGIYHEVDDYMYSKKQKEIAAAEKAEKQRLEAIAQWEKFQKEKEKYSLMYKGKDPRQLAKVPDYIKFDENDLPHKYVKNNKNNIVDEYTVYISLKANSTLYHTSPKCLKQPHKTNYYYINQYHYKPCKKCKPTTDNIDCCKEYIRIKNIKDKYDIE